MERSEGTLAVRACGSWPVLCLLALQLTIKGAPSSHSASHNTMHFIQMLRHTCF